MSLKTVSIADIAAPDKRSIAIGPFGSSLKADLYVPSGVPVVRGQNIKDGGELDESDLVFVEPETAARFPACLLNEGDLVFPHRGAIGRVGIVGKRQMLLSSSMMKLTVDPLKADPRFVFYYFRGPGQHELLMRASTVGTPGIGQPLTSLRGIPIQIPELDQQRAVAEVLGALDDKIAANTDLAAKASEVALLTASRFAPSVPLGEIAIHKKKSISPRALQVPKVSHFSLPAFDAGELPELSSPHDIKSSKFLIESPSVLISKLNPRFPRVWNVAEVPPVPALSSTEFLVLESPFTTTAVLWSLLRQEAFGAELESKVAGTSGSHQRVKPADLLATHIADPRTIGESAAEQITALGAVSAKCRVENRTLAETRDSLLPQLMSGNLRVKEAEAMVAAAV